MSMLQKVGTSTDQAGRTEKKRKKECRSVTGKAFVAA
jgi:hypothetical protein